MASPRPNKKQAAPEAAREAAPAPEAAPAVAAPVVVPAPVAAKAPKAAEAKNTSSLFNRIMMGLLFTAIFGAAIYLAVFNPFAAAYYATAGLALGGGLLAYVFGRNTEAAPAVVAPVKNDDKKPAAPVADDVAAKNEEAAKLEAANKAEAEVAAKAAAEAAPAAPVAPAPVVVPAAPAAPAAKAPSAPASPRASAPATPRDQELKDLEDALKAEDTKASKCGLNCPKPVSQFIGSMFSAVGLGGSKPAAPAPSDEAAVRSVTPPPSPRQ